MRISWTSSALSDLVRLHEHLYPVAPTAADRIVAELAASPDRLRDSPRIGERVSGYPAREVRRIIVGQYELRYEIRADEIIVLRLWHSREHRGPL